MVNIFYKFLKLQGIFLKNKVISKVVFTTVK